MTIHSSVKVHATEVRVEIEARTWKALVRAVVAFHTAVRRALNVSNPRPYLTPSKEGEPPRKRTGFGQANVIYQLDEPNLTAQVGVQANARYMAMHELGIRGVKRPWLVATLEKMIDRLRQIAIGALKK